MAAVVWSAGVINSHEPARADVPRCIRDIECLSFCELEQLYRQAECGPAPCGAFRGRVFYPPCKRLAGPREKVSNLLWRGKHIDIASATSINQWPGFRAIRAEVSVGESWLDGRPAHILDYRNTSLVWKNARDEMRQLSPGLYVGLMYLEGRNGTTAKVLFVIEAADR